MVRLCPAGGCLRCDIDALFIEAARFREEGKIGAAAALYRRVLELSPRHPDACQILGVLAQQSGKHELALSLYDDALSVRPDFPQVQFNRSLILRQLGRNDEALLAALQAADADPDLAEAWDMAGQLARMKGDFATATRCHHYALALRPDNAHFHGNYALLLFTQGDMVTALQAAAEAGRLDPRYPPSLQGNILQAMGHPEKAAAYFARVRALRPDFAAASASEAMARLQMGDFEEGWRLWEQRPDMESGVQEIPLWDGGKVARLLVYEDQGLGDAIQFMRYIPLLKDRVGKIILRMRAPLRDLCADNFPEAEIVNEVVEAEARCRLSSLAFFFKTRLDTIPRPPYIAAPVGKRALWREKLRGLPRPRIGIAWAGNPNYRHDGQRSLAFEQIRVLFDCGAAHFVSLQKPADPALLAAANVFDAAPFMNDFSDSAALIAELDLVISVDTAVAHLAGALQKPVWILLPFASDWRWLLGRRDSPWYPSARLFRQARRGVWPVEKLAADLAKFIGGDRAVLQPEKWTGPSLRRHPDAVFLPE